LLSDGFNEGGFGLFIRKNPETSCKKFQWRHMLPSIIGSSSNSEELKHFVFLAESCFLSQDISFFDSPLFECLINLIDFSPISVKFEIIRILENSNFTPKVLLSSVHLINQIVNFLYCDVEEVLFFSLQFLNRISSYSFTFEETRYIAQTFMNSGYDSIENPLFNIENETETEISDLYWNVFENIKEMIDEANLNYSENCIEEWTLSSQDTYSQLLPPQELNEDFPYQQSIQGFKEENDFPQSFETLYDFVSPCADDFENEDESDEFFIDLSD
jgi:hypothetical protein